MVEVRDLKPIEEYSPEELLDQLRRHYAHLLFTTLAFLRERGVDPQEWMAHWGQASVSSWAFIQGDGPDTMMYWLLLNLAAGGARVRQVSITPRRAEALVSDWPGGDPGRALRKAIPPSELDGLYDRFRPVAATLGLTFEHRPQGDAVRLVIAEDRRR
ncbi:MAG: hypothetical protein HYZ68_06415 [Chloroflexi bacterium]|nr:hypothetical protein [Chloroflexota bacterium]